MTTELLRQLLDAKRAKLEPFNSGFVRLFMRRPTFDLKSMPAMNRFFAEGAPEWSSPTLVRMDVAAPLLG